MPIYEYECTKCGHEFEREQRMSDAPVKTCPECKGRKVTKLISRSSFVLKGGGWYADGYADSKKSEDSSKSSGSSDESTSESSAPSESSSTDKKKDKGKDKGSKGTSKKASKQSAA
ncbi:MAG: zinc ribbon domain-containing protein [Myxococcota bacterium]|nr:zinc ribbon domain-containing protein [Myxococcota bacterium]